MDENHWHRQTSLYKINFLNTYFALALSIFLVKDVEFWNDFILLFCRVIFGMLVSLPVTLLYNVLLGLKKKNIKKIFGTSSVKVVLNSHEMKLGGK